jgi:hypothetical protein
MMRIAFTSVLAASLLIHAALGCCRHCAQETCDCDHAPISLAMESACCHDHHDSAHKHGHEKHDPCKRHSTCHGMCNYLPAQKSQTGKILSLVPVHITLETATADGVRLAGYHDAELTGRPFQPPLRLHLLLQTILV